MKVVGCGGGCGLWRFWVVVEVMACFMGFVGIGMGRSGQGCRIKSGMWVGSAALDGFVGSGCELIGVALGCVWVD